MINGMKKPQIKNTSISSWLKVTGRPLLISGPCGAESREQLVTTAIALKKTGLVSAFRAGIWKPRTRLHSFEGHGEKALSWLKEVKEKTSMPVAVEVAKPEHIELCLKYDVDIVWIGARSVVNPFSIQELAEALTGTNIPVLIKNPVNPDIKLWVGALERINQAGIDKLAAVHRGFNTWGEKQFRNTPLWEIPIELKRLFPQLPIICDPSHICGNRKMIEKVAQHALDLNMDGLMIESHNNPQKALSDKNQQITPLGLKKIIDKLQIRKATDFEEETEETLSELRKQIDVADYKILEAMAERINIVRNIGKLKKSNKITILQIERWNNIIHDRKKTGLSLGLNKEFLNELLHLIHKEAIYVQKQILNNNNK